MNIYMIVQEQLQRHGILLFLQDTISLLIFILIHAPFPNMTPLHIP